MKPREKKHPKPPAGKGGAARAESPQELKKRAGRICAKLMRLYGERGTALRFDVPFQLLVATVLSAQCTDDQVNRVTPSLFAAYPTADAMSRAEPAAIEKLIHSTGFFRQKARSILALAGMIVGKFDGRVPEEMEALTTLPGVGRKTANLVRAMAFGHPGLIVDTHFRRLVQRMGLADTDDPTKIEYRIAELLPEKHWTKFSNSLIWHGRAVCPARKPDCPRCIVREDCPTGREEKLHEKRS